jgi:hypothetical protein
VNLSHLNHLPEMITQFEMEKDMSWDVKSVATLALACDQGKGVARCGPRNRPGSHITCSQECKESRECEGMNPHTPK